MCINSSTMMINNCCCEICHDGPERPPPVSGLCLKRVAALGPVGPGGLPCRFDFKAFDFSLF